MSNVYEQHKQFNMNMKKDQTLRKVTVTSERAQRKKCW